MSRLEEMRALLNKEVDQDALKNKLLEKTDSFNEIMETIVEYAYFPDSKAVKHVSANGQADYITMNIRFKEIMEKEYCDYSKYHMNHEEVEKKVKDYPYGVSIRVKFKEYFEESTSSRFLSKKYDISRKTIETWVRKTKLKIDVRVDHRPGNCGKTKSKNLTLEDYKERYEILKKYQAFLQARREKK